MKRVFGMGMAVVLVMLCCAVVWATDPLPKPDVLTEETIFTSEKLSKNYDTLIIKDFTAEGAEYSRVNDEERAVINQMLPILVSNVAQSLETQLKGKKVFKSILRNAAPRPGALILEGRFVEFNAGSRAMKYFIGFGAGKAYLKHKGRLVDAMTGKELAVFEDRETGYRGSMSMESFKDLFPHQALSMGEHLANFVEKLY